MPRFSGKKPFHHEIFSRHLGEIRNLLHALELRDAFDDGENRPMLDMYETSETIVLEFDLPGFRLEDISLTVRGVTLVLDAQRPREKTEDQVRFVCVERSHGCFHHAVHIPVSVDPCTIAAEYRRGVLRVTCRKNGDQQVPIKEILD
jgi:HSP20 family protein